MSTVHHSPYWPAQRGAAHSEHATVKVAGDDLGRTIYRPKDFNKQMILLFSSLTIGDVNEKMALIAKQTIQRLNHGEIQLSNPLGVFFCNPAKTTLERLQDLKASFSSAGLKKISVQHREMLKTLGITQSKLNEVYPKVAELVEEFFQEKTGTGKMMFFGVETPKNHYLFSKDQTGQAIFNWTQQITLEAMDFIYRKMGAKCLGPVRASEEAIQVLGLTEEKTTNMSCFQYALMNIDLETAKAFSSGKYKHDTDLETCLMDRGWRSVQQPDEGDLVVCYNHIQKTAQHAGVYKENGMVESKPGICNPATYELGLYDLLGLYGTSVYFMRRPPASI